MDQTSQILGALSTLKLKRAKALLFFLIITLGQIHRSDKIVDLLWQSSGAKDSAASYRQTVRQLRLAIDDACNFRVETSPSQIGLVCAQPCDFMGDLAHLLRDDRRWDQATHNVRLCLAQIDTLFGVSNSLDSWLVITQSTMVAGIRKTLDKALTNSTSQDRRYNVAHFALEIEPSNEIAVRHLMRFHWKAGAPTRSIEVYNELYKYLDHQFDQEPSSATANLVAEIKLDPEGGPNDTAVDDIRPRITVAVECGDDEDLSAEDRSMIRILGSDIRRRLSRFREWQVIDENFAVDAIILLQLSLFVVAGKQTLHVEVSRPSEGALVWSDVISEPTRNWDSKAHPVLMNIANALSIEIAERSGFTLAADTFDKWLRSQTLLDAWSPDTESDALAMLRDVANTAPKFGPAHAELAGALNVRHVLLPGTFQTEEVKQSALHHALEAVTIDPLDTRAHRVLAWCYCHKGEFDLAEFHFEQALSLNNDNPLTLASAALGFAFSHHLERAEELARRTAEQHSGMQPFHKIYLAATCYLCGDFEEAIRLCVDGAGLMTTVGGWHCAALWKTGETQKARARYQSFRDEIQPKWKGDEEFDDTSLTDWFAALFPLRQDLVRANLHQTIVAASTPAH